ncbi:hypothetical protein C8A03DRAFT_37969 [Achaetomium macrosporum]|uniref:Fungal N-terminal domain-containing protein n=1 Tax=Achaetomium macrosporum TaxID=79813 RepID=A0AAN7C2P3_9PEZI|nr:hypothetical protein C8A03DRAFT_37969 [Achaetomium macrosporum]
MDPLTAIGLASNILSFIDFGAKVVSRAVDVYGSASGLTSEDQISEGIATHMCYLCSKLRQPQGTQLTGEEVALANLAAKCEDLSKQIIALVEKSKPKTSDSKWATALASVKPSLSLQLSYLTR